MNETLSREKKALSAKAIEKMKSGDKDKSDIGENVGLRRKAKIKKPKQMFRLFKI